jgi:hypothetical protein
MKTAESRTESFIGSVSMESAPMSGVSTVDTRIDRRLLSGCSQMDGVRELPFASPLYIRDRKLPVGGSMMRTQQLSDHVPTALTIVDQGRKHVIKWVKGYL